MSRFEKPYVRATTPRLDELVRRPTLDRITVQEGSGLDMSDQPLYTPPEPKSEARPLPPVVCEAYFDTPLLEQFEALERAGRLRLDFLKEEGRQKLRDLPRPDKVGKELRTLSQLTFGPGRSMFGEMHLFQVPSKQQFMDPHFFASYLRRNNNVGMEYDFACALPCTDGATWLMVTRSGNGRYLGLRHKRQQALTSWHYLIGNQT